MEIVLIDRFAVPKESMPEFLQAVHHSSSFLRTLPGFVEGFVFQNTDGGRQNVITTAVWADEDSFQNARKAAAVEFQKRGFNPPEIMKRLGVELERGVFSRSPY